MKRALEVISAIEDVGGCLTLGKGGAIHYRVPKHNPRAQALLEQLRHEKPALVAYLKSQVPSKEQTGNRGDSDFDEHIEASARHFGQLHSRLPLLIGKRVWTPKGVGKLVSVFSARCEVHLDGTHKKIRLLPGEICAIQ